MNDIRYIIKVNNMYINKYGGLTDFRSEAKDYKSLTWVIKKYQEYKNLGCKVTVFKYVWKSNISISEFNIEDYMLQRKMKLI